MKLNRQERILIYIHRFHDACWDGDFDKVKIIDKWLEGKVEPKHDYINYDKAFRVACKRGHLKVAQWLWKEKESSEVFNIDEIDLEKAFYQSCEEGHLDIAKWIYEIGSFEIILGEHDETFDIVCMNGYLEIAKWLWEDTIDEINIDDAFGYACKYGHLKVVQWLWEIQQSTYNDFAFYSYNDYGFREACRNKHIQLAQWLVSLWPHRYQIGETNEPIIIKFNFPKTEAECIICTENKTCYQVSCCQKEMCHECLERISDRCPHCRRDF